MRAFSQRGLAALAVVAFAIAACTPPKPVVRPPPPPPVQVKKPPPMREPTPPSPPSNELEQLMRSDAELSAFIDDAQRRRVQLLVAIPTDGGDGAPRLRRIGFRVDAEYFYPASAVKLYAAYGAAEKLDELAAEAKGRAVGLTTPVRFIGGDGASRRVLKTTLQKEMEKALVVSDNDAYDRLFDFVGQSELAARLARIGLRSSRVVQHLGEVSGGIAPAIELLPRDGKPILVAQRLGFDPPPPLRSDEALLGNAHVEGGKRVSGPMDFSVKNTVTLGELQDLLVAIGRPDLYDHSEPLRLSTERREELAAILEMLPSQLKMNARAPKSKQRGLDRFHKPIHLGVPRALPGHKIRVLEKGGRAFGFAVENAYVVDETTGRSFFLAANIYANDDETLNDDQYDYGSVALPFLSKLGEVLARALLTTSK